MSLFPRFTQEFSPLFRLLDDYDRQTSRHFNNVNQQIRSFTPKFDVQELKDAYELHGEFPGIEQENIHIEWSDANTLTISGRHETVREEGTKPQAAIEGAQSSDPENHYHKPTVEEEGADGSTSTPVETQVTKKHPAEQELAKSTDENGSRYWVSERSVGEFHRSFAFPARIDQDAVKASLKNGILSIVVPKAKAPQPRKINIE